MRLAATLCALALSLGADAPFADRTAPEGVYEKPVRRYVEVLFDLMALPPGMMSTTPGDPLSALTAPPPAALPEPAAPAGAAPELPPAPPATGEGVPGLPPPPPTPAPPVQLAIGPSQVGGETIPALCLHPEGVLQATLAFRGVWLRPIIGEWPRTFLLFKAGLADPVVKVEGAQEPTPLTLTVTVGDRLVFSEEIKERRWRFYAVELSDFAGKDVGEIVFRASTLNPGEAVSVACVGEPLIVEEQGVYYLSTGGRRLGFGFSLSRYKGGPGLALAQVDAADEAVVSLTVGGETRQFELRAGRHWLPMAFGTAGRFQFRPVSGQAELLRLDVAPFEYKPGAVPGPGPTAPPAAPAAPAPPAQP